MTATVLQGDARTLPLDDASVDAIVTDPPYELGFMGRAWDCTGVAYDAKTWTEALRVLKPGGHLLAFGGTRTWHRLAVAIEDAGFELRDTIAWLYGSGFPKSSNVAKVTGQECWAGWGTALKPAFEPIVVARKPFRGAVAGNVMAHGTGALNIDGCRLDSGPSRTCHTASAGKHRDRWDGNTYTGVVTIHSGRWPANVVLSHADECGDVCEPGCSVAELDSQRSDASNFFPTFRYQAKAPAKERPRVDGVAHPTVKPLALMRWLVRLVTPPEGTVLDPFAGSGTTAEAALLEGLHTIAVERDPAYLPLIEARLRRVGWRC